jgi:hypothetical protein
MRLGLIAISLLMASTAMAEADVSGTFSSPLGRLKVSGVGGVIEAKAARSGGPCGFKKGQVVFEGAQIDDSITGTVNACKVGDGCSGPVSGMIMLLVSRGGSLMSGAVHLETGSCKTPLGGDAITLKRSQGKKPKKPKKPKTPKKPKVKKADRPPVHTSDPKPGKREAAEAHAFEAQSFFEMGMFEDARGKLKEAVGADPTYDQGYNLIGVTYYVRDRYDEALEWYKKALEINPANHDVYYNMACVYAINGDKEQALRYLQIAVLNGYVAVESIKTDHDLKNLHGDPTFEQLKSGQL